MLQNPIVRIILAILVLTVFLGACVLGPMFYDLGFGASEETAELTVAASSNVIPAFEEIADEFEEQYNAEVDFTFGSTSQLAGQIESGAPIDIFAAADTATIEHLDESNWIISDTITPYAEGRLVLWMPNDADLRIDSIEELASEDVRRIAIGNPDYAPYGVAAREALQSAGLWDRLEPNIVPSQSVRAALQSAETGNVDVAIVALSLAVESDGGYWVEIPRDLHEPIVQSMAVTVRNDHEDAARTFVEFVTGPEGWAILERYEFEIPSGTGR
jgi:molybdate transport system substrate-binding protein